LRDQDGSAICVSEADYPQGGHITMSVCTQTAAINGGQPYELVSRYDASQSRVGAMGIMLAFVAHSR
jgi:hypothetical protein